MSERNRLGAGSPASVTSEPYTAARSQAPSVSIATLVGATLIFECIDALDLGVTVASQAAFLGMIATAFVLTARSLLSSVAVPAPLSIVAWSAFVTLTLASSPFAVLSSRADPFTDTVVALMLAMFYVILAEQRVSADALRAALLAIGLASMLPTTYAWLTAVGGDRFEAPAIVTLAAPWLLLLCSGRHRFGPLIVVVSLVIMVLNLNMCLASRSRTALLVFAWMLVAFPVAWLASGRRQLAGRTLVLSAGAFLATALLINPGVVHRLPALVEQARLTDIVTGRLDNSSEARLVEVGDAVDTMQNEGTAANHMLGLGPGATYAASQQNIITNVDENGRTHNIHVTPVTLWFRYGWVGLALFGLLVAGAARGHWSTWRQHRDAGLLLLVFMGAYLIDMTARNSLTDPIFALVVAAGVALGVRRR